MKSICIMVFAMFAVINQSLFAQSQSENTRRPQPPVPVEVLGGHKAISYQHVILRDLNYDKLDFFNVAAFDANYSQNTNTVFVVQSMLSYKIVKGLAIGVGGQLQNMGMFGIAGARYSYASERVLFVAVPIVSFTSKTFVEQLLLAEWHPKLSSSLNAYLRVQLLGNTDFEQYSRGYQQFRLGIETMGLQLGLAANFDQFDDNAVTTNNIGGFVRVLVF